MGQRFSDKQASGAQGVSAVAVDGRLAAHARSASEDPLQDDAVAIVLEPAP